MWFATLTGYLAPVFLVLSPVISYSDQAISMHRNKSSAGFSLDIPLIMLVSSLLKCVATLFSILSSLPYGGAGGFRTTADRHGQALLLARRAL